MIPEEENSPETKTVRPNGCGWIVIAWLIAMALACLGWFGGQVYQVWTG